MYASGKKYADLAQGMHRWVIEVRAESQIAVSNSRITPPGNGLKYVNMI